MIEKSPLGLIDATKLVDLLTSEKEFRETFQRSPSEAMLLTSPEAAAAASRCSMPREPVSVEVPSCTRDRIVDSLTSGSAFR